MSIKNFVGAFSLIYLITLTALAPQSWCALKSNRKLINRALNQCARLLLVTPPIEHTPTIKFPSAKFKEGPDSVYSVLSIHDVIWKTKITLTTSAQHDYSEDFNFTVISNLVDDAAENLVKNHYEKHFISKWRQKRFKYAIEKLGSGDREKTNFHRVFDSSDSVENYQKYLSPMQQYFSTVMMSYAALRMPFTFGQNLQIAELGPGVGDTTSIIQKIYPNAKISVMDRSTSFSNHFQKHFPNVDFILGDFGKDILVFNNESLDLVVSISAMSQYLTRKGFLHVIREINRVLKPGGYLLFEVGPSTMKEIKKIDLPLLYAALDLAGFEPESNIKLGLNLGTQTYFPILLRKKLKHP